MERAETAYVLEEMHTSDWYRGVMVITNHDFIQQSRNLGSDQV